MLALACCYALFFQGAGTYQCTGGAVLPGYLSASAIVVLHDSRVCLGVVSKGRSSSPAMNRVVVRTSADLLGRDLLSTLAGVVATGR